MTIHDIKILIVEVEGLASTRFDRIECEHLVLSKADAADDLEAQYLSSQPDVVIIDGLVSVLDRILAVDPDAKIAVLASNYDRFDANMFLRRGACVFLTDGASNEEILLALAKAKNGEPYIEHAVALRLVAENMENSNLLSKLTERERDVLGQLGAGLSFDALAETLGIETKSVWNLCNRLRDKLNAGSTAELRKLATQLKHDLGGSR